MPLFAQDDDLLSLVDDEDKNTTNFARASFKTTRVINSHSLENVAAGVLDFKISHRFGVLNNGFYDIFGLDNATIRFGLDYGITPRLMVGLGRSTFEKTYDGFIKYKLLRQSKGKRNMPITASLVAGMSINTLKWANPDRDNYFSSRLSYYYQLIIGRKFGEGFSMQIMPTLVHRNLVETRAEKNDVISIGIAARQKLSKRIAVNAEYFYVLPNQIAESYRNSLSVGFDIETGGHVFQLHFTNSTPMTEKGFITETSNNWLDGDIHFGFNISRVFTIAQPKNREE
ncbi:MAG: hypothetical protein IPL33_16280 [Sphingobacteriales bacterium]|nr:hypothetical protein [Sphingobacteriales bacterium]MCC7224229.1 hypothetical protein [Chitinophagales bacterium]